MLSRKTDTLIYSNHKTELQPELRLTRGIHFKLFSTGATQITIIQTDFSLRYLKGEETERWYKQTQARFTGHSVKHCAYHLCNIESGVALLCFSTQTLQTTWTVEHPSRKNIINFFQLLLSSPPVTAVRQARLPDIIELWISKHNFTVNQTWLFCTSLSAMDWHNSHVGQRSFGNHSWM